VSINAFTGISSLQSSGNSKTFSTPDSATPNSLAAPPPFFWVWKAPPESMELYLLLPNCPSVSSTTTSFFSRPFFDSIVAALSSGSLAVSGLSYLGF